jgi:hypothetical protein
MNLNLSSAARACGVNRKIIEKARKEGRFPNASHSGGAWLIPVDDLVSAGFTPSKEWLRREEHERAKSTNELKKRTQV